MWNRHAVLTYAPFAQEAVCSDTLSLADSPGDLVFVEEPLPLVLRQISQTRLEDSAEGDQQGSRVVDIDPLLDLWQPERRRQERRGEIDGRLIRLHTRQHATPFLRSMTRRLHSRPLSLTLPSLYTHIQTDAEWT